MFQLLWWLGIEPHTAKRKTPHGSEGAVGGGEDDQLAEGPAAAAAAAG